MKGFQIVCQKCREYCDLTGNRFAGDPGESGISLREQFRPVGDEVKTFRELVVSCEKCGNNQRLFLT